MIRFSCPVCTQHLSAAEGAGGRKIECPSCRQRLQIPIPPAATDDEADGSGRPPVPYTRPDQGVRYVVAAACGVVGLKVLLLVLVVALPVLLIIAVYLVQIWTVRSALP